MLTAITGKNELAKLQKFFKKKLAPHVTSTHKVTIGHPGGSWIEQVHYSKELDIWWCLAIEASGKRYWNAFGVGKPVNHVNITVEINYPLQGRSFHIAGNWVKNESGKHFLFHSGKVGGGKKGVGRSAFISFYAAEKHQIVVDGYSRDTILIGALDEPNFVYQIKDFVHEVYRFKNAIATEVPQDFEFSKEFDGTKTFGLPVTVTINANHGIIVNGLRDLLTEQGQKVGNNGQSGRVDLFVYNGSREITHLFEVKSSLSLQSLCTAIGQLFLYSNSLKPAPKLILVCPNDVPHKIAETLMRLGIGLLKFKIISGKPQFQDINLLFR